MRPINVLELRCATGSGGPEKTILLSAEKSDRSHFNVVVAYIRNGNDKVYTVAQRALDLGLNFRDLDERFSLDPRTPARLARLIARERIDVVHAHEYKSNLLGVLLRPLLRFKLVSTAHGWVTRSPKLDAYYSLDKLALRYCDRVMCVSPDLREELLHRGVSADRLVYLPNGIDSEAFRRNAASATLRRELNLTPHQPLIAAIGRLTAEKDLATFLHVAHGVRQQLPDAHFLIVGEGGDRASLERLAETLQLKGSVSFLGQRADMLNVYSSLDLFLLTSLREGLPNVVLEAMAMEVPVISTQVAGVGELISDGETGRLFQQRDVEGITGAALAVLRDPALASRLASAARDRVCRNFSFVERVRKLERIYLEVVEGSRERSS